MDYKAEYQRITGRPWPLDEEPYSGSYEDLAALWAFWLGPAEAKTLPNGATQYTWRPLTREEMLKMIARGWPPAIQIQVDPRLPDGTIKAVNPDGQEVTLTNIATEPPAESEE